MLLRGPGGAEMTIRRCEGFNQQIYPQVDSFKNRIALSWLRDFSCPDPDACVLPMLRTKYLAACRTQVLDSETQVQFRPSESENRF
jgi:hypothetical protein